MQTLSIYTAALAVLLLLSVSPSAVSAQYGSTYLGCFSFSRMLYLKGVEGVKVSVHALSKQVLHHLTSVTFLLHAAGRGQAAVDALAVTHAAGRHRVQSKVP